MSYGEILKSIGDKASELSVTGMNVLTDKTGLNSTNLSAKLLTIVILSGLLFLGTKITNKMAKFVFFVAVTLLIISIGSSIFA